LLPDGNLIVLPVVCASLSIPIFSKIFDKSGIIIDAAKKILNEPKFAEKLGQAGGFVSLVGVGIEIYNDIKESLKTEEEKAFGALLKITFESANETLDRFKEIQIEKPNRRLNRTIMGSLLDAFGKTSEWNSYLQEHPSVREFRKIISTYLKEKGVDSNKINEFILNFNLRIEAKASKNEAFRKFYDWWTLEEQYNELKEYLEYVKNKMYYLKGIDIKPLYEYYVWNKAVVATVDTWDWNDKQFYDLERYRTEIKDIRKIIKEFLQSGSNKWYLVVGAPFGIGKTSMVRMIASLYASSYLNRAEDEEREIAILNKESDKQYFVPILVFLKAGLNNVYQSSDLDDVLSDIAPYEANYNTQQTAKRPLLLILDGLDEYRDSVEDLIKNTIFDKIHKKYRKNMKVIITTRLEAGFPDELKITGNIDEERNTYVRLLPFTTKQADEFFRNYNAPLTYDTAQKLGLHEEEITKPLFAWMISLMYTDPELKIEFGKDWSSSMMKSLIYMLFFHYLITGRYRTRLNPDEWSRIYVDEKRALRRIAVLKQIYGNELTEDTVKKVLHIRMLSNKNKDSDDGGLTDTFDIEPIISSYFYLANKTKGKIIDFMHSSFKEYLLAEYYIESLLNDKIQNIGIPSEVTIQFLEGLVKILNSEDRDVKRFVQGDKINEVNLLNSMDYNEGLEKARLKLSELTLKYLNEDRIILFKFSDLTMESEANEDVNKKDGDRINTYENHLQRAT
jgi:hypothetical protein